MLGRLIVVALFVGYLVEQSPHLVHHLLETDEIQSGCAYLAAGDRHQVTPVEATALFSEPAVVSVVAVGVETRPSTNDPGPTGARAPPAIS
jgi:hypothetical protein